MNLIPPKIERRQIFEVTSPSAPGSGEPYC